MKNRVKKQLKTIKKGVMPKLIKGDTWLPIFTGYYNTIFDESERSLDLGFELSESEFKEYWTELSEAGVTFKFFKENAWKFVDFKEAFNEASRTICYAILKLEHAGIISDIDYEKLVSPREYNFSSDSINCKITYNPKKLKKYIESNFEAFSNYIKDRYTRRDGFIPHYSNDVTKWIDYENLGEHQLGSVLNFVIINEYGGDEQEAMMALFWESNISEDFINYRDFDTQGMIEAFNKTKKAV